jgi:hypothetical protein
MPNLSRGERLQIMLSAQEIGALDDWRFARRLPSRAAAIRELLRRGLAADAVEQPTVGKKSMSYGVLEAAPSKRKPNGSKSIV